MSLNPKPSYSLISFWAQLFFPAVLASFVLLCETQDALASGGFSESLCSLYLMSLVRVVAIVRIL